MLYIQAHSQHHARENPKAIRLKLGTRQSYPLLLHMNTTVHMNTRVHMNTTVHVKGTRTTGSLHLPCLL